MFNNAETPKKASGTTEFPMARSRAGEIIIEENSRNPPENDPQIVPHQGYNAFRHLKQLYVPPNMPKSQPHQNGSYRCQSEQTNGKALFQALPILLAIAQRKNRSAAMQSPNKIEVRNVISV